MSDIDGFLTHCYDLLLQAPQPQKGDNMQEDDELCACAKLIERSEA